MFKVNNKDTWTTPIAKSESFYKMVFIVPSSCDTKTDTNLH